MLVPDLETGQSAPPSEKSRLSDSTTATSISPEAENAYEDDIFADDGDARDQQHTNANIPSQRGEMLSDLPIIQRQHMTTGYREGLSEAKAKSMQGGFDQGYPIGFELGIRVGRILGALEGCVAAYSKKPEKAPTELLDLYAEASKELKIGKLLDGLDDEVLAREDFTIENLPRPAWATLHRWEEIMSSILRE